MIKENQWRKQAKEAAATLAKQTRDSTVVLEQLKKQATDAQKH